MWSRRERRFGLAQELVGFECATAFGDEAKDPLRNIPKAVIWSLVISGAFFVFVTYTMVLGVRGYSQPLSALDAPLNTLATMYNVPILAVPLSIGAMVSFFALCLSCINAGGRVIYSTETAYQYARVVQFPSGERWYTKSVSQVSA